LYLADFFIRLLTDLIIHKLEYIMSLYRAAAILVAGSLLGSCDKAALKSAAPSNAFTQNNSVTVQVASDKLVVGQGSVFNFSGTKDLKIDCACQVELKEGPKDKVSITIDADSEMSKNFRVSQDGQTVDVEQKGITDTGSIVTYGNNSAVISGSVVGGDVVVRTCS
jgi:hypothetical protein